MPAIRKRRLPWISGGGDGVGRREGQVLTLRGQLMRLEAQNRSGAMAGPSVIRGCCQSGLALGQSFIVCNGVVLPKADCASCWLQSSKQRCSVVSNSSPERNWCDFRAGHLTNDEILARLFRLDQDRTAAQA